MVEGDREAVTERLNTTLANVEDSWAETATSILFSVLLFLAIYLTAKLYGLVKGKSISDKKWRVYCNDRRNGCPENQFKMFMVNHHG